MLLNEPMPSLINRIIKRNMNQACVIVFITFYWFLSKKTTCLWKTTKISITAMWPRLDTYTCKTSRIYFRFGCVLNASPTNEDFSRNLQKNWQTTQIDHEHNCIKEMKVKFLSNTSRGYGCQNSNDVNKSFCLHHYWFDSFGIYEGCM